MQIEVPPHLCADIRRSAIRPVLLMGCERKALIFVAMSTAVIAVSVVPIKVGLTLAVLWGLVWLEVFRFMARKDPMLIRLYLEHRRYANGFWTALPSSYGPRSRGALLFKVLQQAVNLAGVLVLIIGAWFVISHLLS